MKIFAIILSLFLFGCYSSKTTQKSKSDSTFTEKSSQKVDSSSFVVDNSIIEKKTVEQFDTVIKTPEREIFGQGRQGNGRFVSIIDQDSIISTYDSSSKLLSTTVKLRSRSIRIAGTKTTVETKKNNISARKAVSSQVKKGTSASVSKKSSIVEKEGILTSWKFWLFLLLFILALLVIWRLRGKIF